MTPILAMVADRAVEILGFVPEAYYVVRITAGDASFESRKIKDRDEVMQLARACKETRTAIVQNVSVKQKFVLDKHDSDSSSRSQKMVTSIHLTRWSLDPLNPQ